MKPPGKGLSIKNHKDRSSSPGGGWRVAEAADLQHGKLAQHHVRGVHRHRGPRGLLRGLSGDQARHGLYRRGQERIGVARSEKVTVMTMRRR